MSLEWRAQREPRHCTLGTMPTHGTEGLRQLLSIRHEHSQHPRDQEALELLIPTGMPLGVLDFPNWGGDKVKPMKAEKQVAVPSRTAEKPKDMHPRVPGSSTSLSEQILWVLFWKSCSLNSHFLTRPVTNPDAMPLEVQGQPPLDGTQDSVPLHHDVVLPDPLILLLRHTQKHTGPGFNVSIQKQLVSMVFWLLRVGVKERSLVSWCTAFLVLRPVFLILWSHMVSLRAENLTKRHLVSLVAALSPKLIEFNNGALKFQ